MLAGDIAWYGLHGLGVEATAALPEELEVAAGARAVLHPWLPGNAGGEGWVALRLSPHLQTWYPAVGLQLGATTALRLDWEEIYGSTYWREGGAIEGFDYAPLWLAVEAAPARFRRGSLAIEVGSFAVGTAGLGRVLRLQLTPVKAGLAW